MTIDTRRLLRLAPLALVALLALASWFQPLDSAAQEHLKRGTAAAFAAFAAARAIDAAISLLRSAEVGVQVGVGVSAHPGALLEPLEDLVEHFADFMLAATVAFGIQQVLVAIGAHWGVALALTVVALAWIAVSVGLRDAAPRWLGRLLALLLLLRFAVPVATVGTELLSRTFLESGQQASQQALDQLRGQAEPAAGTGGAARDAGAWATVRDWLAKGVDLGAQVDRLAALAGRMTEQVTTLIVVFLLQTLVFPVALAWMLVRAARALLRPW
jgi:hypothetical protein